MSLPGGPEPGVLYPAISIDSGGGIEGSFSSVEVFGGGDAMVAGIGQNEVGETIIWAGSPPIPEIAEINVSGTGVVLRVSGVASGMTYEVDGQSDLSSNSWMFLDSPVSPGSSDIWTDSTDRIPTSAVYRALYRTFD